MGLNSVAVEVSMGTAELKENDNLKLVYEAVGYGTRVFWRDNQTLMIINCSSEIDFIESEYVFEYEKGMIYVQPIIARRIEVDGVLYCNY